jgi:hypothetical protein
VQLDRRPSLTSLSESELRRLAKELGVELKRKKSKYHYVTYPFHCLINKIHTTHGLSSEELGGPALSVRSQKLSNVGQSLDGCPRIYNPHWARVVGYGPFYLCVIYKEGLCPNCGDINRLIMMTVYRRRDNAQSTRGGLLILYLNQV